MLLQALVHRSHDLLQEEITITIYNMASVDFDSFYTGFLPQFLAGCEGVTQSQKSELNHNFKFDKVRKTDSGTVTPILGNPGAVSLERGSFKISNANRSEAESGEAEGRSASPWSYRTSSGPA